MSALVAPATPESALNNAEERTGVRDFTFFAQEDIAGRSTLLRITWEESSAHERRWEQSFSHDGGRSWQLDWTMAFTRE